MARIMTVRPPEDTHARLKKQAKKRGLTLNGLILNILWEWLKANDKEENNERI